MGAWLGKSIWGRQYDIPLFWVSHARLTPSTIPQSYSGYRSSATWQNIERIKSSVAKACSYYLETNCCTLADYKQKQLLGLTLIVRSTEDRPRLTTTTAIIFAEALRLRTCYDNLRETNVRLKSSLNSEFDIIYASHKKKSSRNHQKS